MVLDSYSKVMNCQENFFEQNPLTASTSKKIKFSSRLNL